MDRFWEWMEKKEYCSLTPFWMARGKNNICFFDSGSYVPFKEVSKQMLIGYMIEYIHEKATVNYSIQIKDYEDINEMYDVLESRIEYKTHLKD
jgi:hypothetical protein